MKKIIVIMLISMLMLTTSTTVYGDTNLTELNQEFPNCMSLIETNQNTYPYYLLYEVDGMKGVILSDVELYCLLGRHTMNNGMITEFRLSQSEFKFMSYFLNDDDTYTLGAQTTFYYPSFLCCHTSTKVWNINSIKYCNYDILDNDGEMVFRSARYPQTAIKDQISGKMITHLTLKEMKILLVFLMGFLISALALRKAWVMLKTILSGA